MQEEQFINALKAQGFEAPVLVERDAFGELDSHAHPFEAKALILEGEIRIRTAEGERTYLAGEIFHLQPDEPHSESFGPQGVRYLSGRKALR